MKRFGAISYLLSMDLVEIVIYLNFMCIHGEKKELLEILVILMHV